MSNENINEVEEVTAEQNEEVKTFTQEEVDKLLQSETDRKTSKALETAKAKWEEEFKAKLESEKSEAEKLAKMSEEERFKAELTKEREVFEAERKAFQIERLEAQTVKELSSSGLPVEFADYLKADSADQIKVNIDTFKEKWTSAIQAAVEDRLKGTTPKVATATSNNISKDDFKRMNLEEKMKLFEENPDVYNSLK